MTKIVNFDTFYMNLPVMSIKARLKAGNHSLKMLR